MSDSELIDILVQSNVDKSLKIIDMKESLRMAQYMIDEMLKGSTVITDNWVRSHKERFDLIRRGLE